MLPTAVTKPDDLLRRAATIARDALAPAAKACDRAPVLPRRNLDRIASAGLLGLAGPPSAGGHDASSQVTREVFELFAGACGVTHFVQAQHHTPVSLLAATDNTDLRDAYLRPLCEGSLLAGIAFSQLRRVGAHGMRATSVRGGLVVEGEAPWVTSWGLAGVLAVGARTPDDEVVFFLLEAEPSAHVHASAPLPLSVLAASATVRLQLSELFVPDSAIAAVMTGTEWARRDRLATAKANPAVFGIARTCARELRALGDTSDDATLRRAATSLADEIGDCRAEAYALADAPTEDSLARMHEVKAWSLDLCSRAARAYVAAVGGRAMGLGHPAERYTREAVFYSIQAQSAHVRASTLERLTAR